MATLTETVLSTVDLIEGMTQMQVPETFLNRTFFPKESFFVGRFCQVDSRKARRLLAPVVKRGQGGRVVAREPFATKFFEVPEIKPARVTSAAELDERAFGETSYSKRSASERLAEIIAQDSADLIGFVTRRIEQMSSSLLFNGSISYLLDSGETESLVYGTVTPVVPAVKWDAASGSDPLADLQTAVNSIVANSGLLPDTLVLGAQVLSVFLGHPKVQDVLNKLNLALGNVMPTKPQAPGTAQYIGRIYRPFLDLYGYSETYEDEANPGTLSR